MRLFSRSFRIDLLERFLGYVHPARASEMHLVYAVQQCEAAERAGARFFASQLFQEASTILGCATYEFQRHHFEQGKILAHLAHQKATDAITIADLAKSVSRDYLRQQLYVTLMSLSELARNVSRPDERMRMGPDKAGERIRKALNDSKAAFQALNEDDFSTARAHLGYARAMTQRVMTSLDDRSLSGTSNNREQKPIPEAFDLWFMRRAEEIDRLLASLRVCEAGGLIGLETQFAQRGAKAIDGIETCSGQGRKTGIGESIPGV